MNAATAAPIDRRMGGRRRGVLIAIALVGVWAGWRLQLNPADLWPDAAHWRAIGRFFLAALTPAWSYETEAPLGAAPLPIKAVYAALTTLIFAVAAASLSTLLGLVLSFFASTAWWADDPVGAVGSVRRWLRKTLRPTIYVLARSVIALMRCTHELIWAVLFLTAFGLTPIAAVIAIAIPYSGTLAKVFSELIDETPRGPSEALRASGAAPMTVFLFGLAPLAIPDLAAYAIYRFECALRAGAVLGFFGVTTLGYYIDGAFAMNHYREVWTYLYALLILVAIVDWWSGALRRRLTA